MPKITFNIIKVAVYSIAEGISVSIAQHNGGTPTYEQLWASPDESRKLDIYYREAISDLEKSLTKWLVSSSAQFNLAQAGDNYTLSLFLNPNWPATLEGLLANKIQDYLVHAVTAGWLNDFTGLEIKQDYQAMAANDLSDIRDIICKRFFHFFTGYRKEDDVNKQGDDDTPPYCREKNLRHRDNAVIDTHSDYTDWSGTGIAYRDQMPHSEHAPLEMAGCKVQNPSRRVAHGRGYTPSPIDKMPAKHPAPPCKRPCAPDNPTHPNYPPIHTDGKEWSDKEFYNEDREERYINSGN